MRRKIVVAEVGQPFPNGNGVYTKEILESELVRIQLGRVTFGKDRQKADDVLIENGKLVVILAVDDDKCAECPKFGKCERIV